MLDDTLRDILAELKAIRRLLEQDRGPIMAIGKPLDPMPPASLGHVTVSPARTRPVTAISSAKTELARRVHERATLGKG